MAIQQIDIAVPAGDNLRDASIKINSNFTQVGDDLQRALSDIDALEQAFNEQLGNVGAVLDAINGEVV